jgi:hypothetical protein
MKHNRRSSRSNVDLIGFLDILSVVIVIVLLVISVLALSISIQGSIQSEEDIQPTREEIVGIPPVKQDSSPQAEIQTIDGRNVTVETAFLLCKGSRIEQFDPAIGQRLRTWNLNEVQIDKVTQDISQPNVYLAVAGSCFPHLEDLINSLRLKGVQLGYEPTTEEAVVPWQ